MAPIDTDALMRKSLAVIIFFALFSSGTGYHVYAEQNGSKMGTAGQGMEVFSVNDSVVNTCFSLDLINRDDFWKGKLNTMLESRGKVLAVEDKSQFRRKYRITVESRDDSRISLLYYIYTDNEDYKDHLQPGSVFGFKGQFVMFTPMNTKRNLYVLDIILEDGAAIVE
jgi:hypothetical protein